jgi:hypothetical protein
MTTHGPHQKAAAAVHKILSDSKIGEDGHSCLDTPFYSGCPRDGEVSDYIKDHKSARHSAKVDFLFDKFTSPFELRILYKILGKVDVEVIFGEWTWLSMNDVEKRMDVYESHGNKNVMDWAVAYAGMGHVTVVSMDRNTGKFFTRMDGGSNGYDREDSMEAAMRINPSEKTLHTFDDIVMVMRGYDRD